MAEFSELPKLETIHSTDSESEPTEISGTFSDTLQVRIPSSVSRRKSKPSSIMTQLGKHSSHSVSTEA